MIDVRTRDMNSTTLLTLINLKKILSNSVVRFDPFSFSIIETLSKGMTRCLESSG